MKLYSFQRTRQAFTLLLAALLGLAIFISPYQLHHSQASIFFVTTVTNKAAEPSHHTHQQNDQQEPQSLRCLRCVLYGFQLPETLAPFIVILVVLGFLKLAKPIQPVSFIMPSKSARAPPL